MEGSIERNSLELQKIRLLNNKPDIKEGDKLYKACVTHETESDGYIGNAVSLQIEMISSQSFFLEETRYWRWTVYYKTKEGRIEKCGAGRLDLSKTKR